ncbi:DUF6123 family protein [Aquibacillus koreensis]|uniref:DUF6123 family protein n=1 Tax=Aquibacillus koreensis TaxID=279446 RepID=A0A9X3WFC6_9BACI|nr:DUF6123 family protein [Aquibacillus koreensis]MCT2537329.1 DUF6123 family protein [Aquibacillus koreensis]MDC3418775.1 DUF6123 family protein [Aquibacillus koreensis]
MDRHDQLANYIEDLWAKGFKLTDEEIRFIYFGKRYTAAPDWKIKMALKLTLQIQLSFDRSFYISLLELLNKDSIQTNAEAREILRDKGFV